uniref:Uncharacterized protein n=1 Tax=Anguilla anguilla TaxID=7936 RepID=A0A0E9RPN7_ANGAN
MLIPSPESISQPLFKLRLLLIYHKSFMDHV